MSVRPDIQLPRFGLAPKLAGCLVGGVLGCFLLFGWFHERLEQRHLEALVSLSAQRISDIVASSAWSAMLHNDRERLYTLIRDFGREPGIRRLRIINEEGLVRHSTQSSEGGTMVDKSAEACYGCHAQSQPLTKLTRKDRVRIFSDADGRRTLAVIRPIENHPECSNAACHAHPASRRILGVIDVHLTLDSVDAQLLEHRRQMAGFITAAAIVGCLLSVAFVLLFVHRPVRELLAGIRSLGLGERFTRIPVHSRDELGVVAEAFNSMAGEVEEAHGEVTEWARTLEDRVQEKTSELERAHKSLVHNEKMASLGRLAATVAHEVNNPLFGMLTYARLSMKDLARCEGDPEVKGRIVSNLQVIERESRRCGDLMKNLLAFSRQAPPKRTATQVNTVIDRACALVQHQCELAQIGLIRELDDQLPEISADPSQVQQVLVVLMVNAVEAMGKGGSITVRTNAMPDAQGVSITLKDTGPGIPEEIQERIFEPFFSTKDDQHRTGLGLAVARGIVERHGGTLGLRSRPGEGAEFTVHLPLVAPPEPATLSPAPSDVRNLE
jgi:two-component system NtrC family sensor kinase